MSYELNTLVRHLMALAGADPRKVRLPEGKYKLRVHSQRIGDVRLVTVAPWQGTLPEVDAQGVAHLCAENDLLLLRGIVSAPPRTKTLWLALDGVGAVPLVPASPRVEKALRTPTTYEAAYAPYKSPEAWWMIRATKAMIEAGNAHPANTRFTYTVYDPQGDAEAMRAAGFSNRYGSSEPDLIVVVKSRSAGQPLWLAVECERGKYNSTRLKQKLAKNLEDYATAGFGGCYYVANNRDTARVLGGTIARLRDDLTARPDTINTPGFLVLFTLESLRDAWLPTPRFILTEFFDRKLQRVNPEWPQDVARPERYFALDLCRRIIHGEPFPDGMSMTCAGAPVL
ncbi:MAG TPA: hypothetical protein PLH19_03795 [Anaerolineae bacterium]|nr:hypothetical protein [Anaerolineae bacterium]HQH37645.1 hypothetical protein [Anaerolineae bacterium]